MLHLLQQSSLKVAFNRLKKKEHPQNVWFPSSFNAYFGNFDIHTVKRVAQFLVLLMFCLVAAQFAHSRQEIKAAKSKAE